MTALKYTDRDVRENPDFYLTAVHYLSEYQGDFQFLIDCKMRVEHGSDLSVGMVRGVLNCMRVDPRVQNLPEPLPPEEFDADVIPMRDSYRKPIRRPGWQQKNEVIEVKPREVRNGGNYSYRLPVTVHPEFIFTKGKSPSTTTIHLVTEAEVEWYPHKYVDQPGWTKSPELIVHTNCKYPYYLRNSKLLTPEDVQEHNDYLTEIDPEDEGLNDHLYWKRCQYCFYSEE